MSCDRRKLGPFSSFKLPFSGRNRCDDYDCLWGLNCEIPQMSSVMYSICKLEIECIQFTLLPL